MRTEKLRIWTQEKSGIYVSTTAIPFDGDKLERLFVFIVKGLIWHHWKIIIDLDSLVQVYSLTRYGEAFFQRYLAMHAKARVMENIGEGTFLYDGAQGVGDPRVTIWKISIYGGLTLAGDPAVSQEQLSAIGCITDPRRTLENVDQKMKLISGTF